MDYAACNVVYVDRTAPEDQLVRRDDVSLAPLLVDQPNHLHGHAPTLRAGVLSTNLQTLLGTFSEGSSLSAPID
jgi:3',5'-cyclic-nucleotide phosphodiesterase